MTMPKKAKKAENPCLSCPKYGRLPYYSTEEYGCLDKWQICKECMDYWMEKGKEGMNHNEKL